jgi:hypothetical protein
MYSTTCCAYHHYQKRSACTLILQFHFAYSKLYLVVPQFRLTSFRYAPKLRCDYTLQKVPCISNLKQLFHAPIESSSSFGKCLRLFLPQCSIPLPRQMQNVSAIQYLYVLQLSSFLVQWLSCFAFFTY